MKLEQLDEVVQSHDGDAILMAQNLAQQVGLAVGISSGANLIGAMRIKEQLGADAVVVTILPDSNKKYLSTDLVKEEPVRRIILLLLYNLPGTIPSAAFKQTCSENYYKNITIYNMKTTKLIVATFADHREHMAQANAQLLKFAAWSYGAKNNKCYRSCPIYQGYDRKQDGTCIRKTFPKADL